jgi:glyoxylase-like metal-dependent hydrolase (beta-lactamase superfamily II)
MRLDLHQLPALRRHRAHQVALIVLPLAAAALAAQRGPAPDPLVKEGTTVKVAPHTYVIPDDNVALVPNVGIVVGSRATLVVDPGLGRRNGETVLREVAKVSHNADLYIVTTHFHPEHTTGYIAFPPSAKYIDANVQEAEFAESGMQMVQSFAGRSTVTADLLKDAAKRKADITFDREYTVSLGDVSVRLVTVGPTHTKGDTVAFVSGDNVLFAGDVVMKESFLAAMASSSMKAWLAAYDTIDAMKPSVIVPSHGGMGTGTLAGENRQLMRAIRDRVVALKAQGKTADETAATIQTEFQALHPTWPRANGLAPIARAAWNE